MYRTMQASQRSMRGGGASRDLVLEAANCLVLDSCRIRNGAELKASGTSAVTPLLRTHTPTRYEGFDVAVIQANVLPTAQSRAMLHVVPSNTYHLYCSGAAPPVAAAVQAIVVPGGCGAVLSADSVTAVTRGCWSANGRELKASG